MDSIRYLVSKYYLNERSYTTTTVASQQFYNLPPQVKKIINVTVTIGSVVWQPKECPSRQYWDALNTITYTQNFPAFFFVYNGQVGIWPTPPTTGSTITMNYKTRIIDLSQTDVTQATASATIAATLGTIPLIATTTTFYNWMVNNYIRIPINSTTNSKNGDNQWYQIASVTSGTQIRLTAPYAGATISGADFTVGEVSILPEDYQDLPLYRMGEIYYTTRFPDKVKADKYKELYNEGFAALNEEFGSKTSSVVLTDTDGPITNPNLFVSSIS